MMRRTLLSVLLAALPLAVHAKEAEEQALFVRIKLSDEAFGATGESASYYTVEDAITKHLEKTKVGEWASHRIGGGLFEILLLGPSCDAIADAVSPILKNHGLPKGSYLLKQYGHTGAREVRVELALK